MSLLSELAGCNKYLGIVADLDFGEQDRMRTQLPNASDRRPEEYRVLRTP